MSNSNINRLYSYFQINFSYGILHIGRVGSVFTTLSVAIDRFYAIKYPLKMIERSHLLIIYSAAFSIIYNIPRFLEFETTSTDVLETEANATFLGDLEFETSYPDVLTEEENATFLGDKVLSNC